jgi:hypothetical protein
MNRPLLRVIALGSAAGLPLVAGADAAEAGTLTAAGGQANMFSVSRGSVGNCSVGGEYTDGSGRGQAFVAELQSGRRGKGWTDQLHSGGTRRRRTVHRLTAAVM